MSIESVAKALQVQTCNGATKLVLLGIANHDGDGGAWPTRATLARYACCSERHVKRCIEDLVDLGYVTVDLNAGGTIDWRDDRRPNRYILHFDGGTPESSRDSDGGTSSAERGDQSVRDGGTPESPKPSSNHPVEPSTLMVIDPFDAFYSAYPRKVKPRTARAAFNAAVKRVKSPECIMSALEDWNQHWRVNRTKIEFIPYPASWLNGDQFLSAPANTERHRNRSRAMERTAMHHAGELS